MKPLVLEPNLLETLGLGIAVIRSEAVKAADRSASDFGGLSSPTPWADVPVRDGLMGGAEGEALPPGLELLHGLQQYQPSLSAHTNPLLERADHP